MSKPKRKTKVSTIAVVVWTCFNLYLCSSAVHDHEKIVGTTDKQFAEVASFILYSVVWAAGLAVIALLKFLLGRK